LTATIMMIAANVVRMMKKTTAEELPAEELPVEEPPDPLEPPEDRDPPPPRPPPRSWRSFGVSRKSRSST